MKNITLIRYNEKSPGVNVIIDAFREALQRKGYNVSVLSKIPLCSKNEILIPYGPKETYDILKRGYKCKLSLMVDYYSMGQFKKCLFYFKRGKLFYKDFWYSLLTALLYYYREYYILKRVENVMLVSQYDISCLKKRFSNCRYFFIPNGVRIPDKECLKIGDSKIRLGILSNWTEVSLSECRWFIEDYMPEIVDRFENIELVIAGKGASERIKQYFISKSFIRYLGKVEDLNSFFDSIDIYVATVPRGCGILNKVLDAFAYKTFVIGNRESFSGFIGMQNSYMICDTVHDFCNVLNLFKDRRAVVNEYVENAYNYILKNNNWKDNYSNFVNLLQSEKII